MHPSYSPLWPWQIAPVALDNSILCHVSLHEQKWLHFPGMTFTHSSSDCLCFKWQLFWNFFGLLQYNLDAHIQASQHHGYICITNCCITNTCPLSTGTSQKAIVMLYLKLDVQGLLRCFGTLWEYSKVYLTNECQTHPCFVWYFTPYHPPPPAYSKISEQNIDLNILPPCCGPLLTQSGQSPDFHLMTKF